MKELDLIQQELEVPKLRYNKHGNFHYRSCEDILNALKPHLKMHECSLKVSDDLVWLGERMYIKGSVTIVNKAGEKETCHGFAKEEASRKGMGGAQLTGSTSSYARKYALNAMFLIDDSRDPDDPLVDETPEGAAQEKPQAAAQEPTQERKRYDYPEDRPWLNEDTKNWDNVLNYILDNDSPELDYIMSIVKVNRDMQTQIKEMITKKMMPNN